MEKKRKRGEKTGVKSDEKWNVKSKEEEMRESQIWLVLVIGMLAIMNDNPGLIYQRAGGRRGEEKRERGVWDWEEEVKI